LSFYESIRPLLFKLDAERAHRLTLGLLALAGGLPPLRLLLTRGLSARTSSQAVEVFGLKFANPVGLAAGYDKDGRAMRGLACLGFGHLELGTVTPLPQAGNPRPRIFRLPEDEALINRMGFPNRGLAPLVRRLRRRPKDVVTGVNIGKGATTPLEAAAEDYLLLLRALYLYADYLVVNVSSPNSPGLRELQDRKHLGKLLRGLDAARAELGGRRIPILVKLAPDLSDPQLAEAVQVIGESGMDGIIASNTTTARPALRSPHQEQTGGLSGAPLRQPALRTIHKCCELSGGRLPVVATGGILSAADAQAALQAGASLVQLYTGLVYRGPGLVREILEALEPREAAANPALQTQ
jgi:dihydroorotate dehydrogenase